MEKPYRIPNYMLNMLTGYLEKNERPSLEDFLEKYPEYRRYACLINKYTNDGEDFLALAGKVFIDRDSIQGYKTEFDKLVGYVKLINNALDNVALGVADSVGLFKRFKVMTPQLLFDVDMDTDSRIDDQIVFWTQCKSTVGLTYGDLWSTGYANAVLCAKKGGLTFDNLTMENLCMLFCEKKGDEKIQQEAERILLKPGFVSWVEEFSDMLYASSRKENPMDILIK